MINKYDFEDYTMNYIQKTHTYYFLYAIIIYSVVFTIVHTLEVQNKKLIPINRLSNISYYLSNSNLSNELIVLSSINTFPEMFYHSMENKYIIGMDWQYLYSKNQKLFYEYYGLLNGDIINPVDFLKNNEFNIILIDYRYEYQDLLFSCQNNDALELIYSDQQCCLYKLIENS